MANQPTTPITPRTRNLIIFILLFVATALEVIIASLSSLPLGLRIGLLVFFAAIKVSLVLLFFMRLRYDNRIFALPLVLGLVLVVPLILIVVLTLPGMTSTTPLADGSLPVPVATAEVTVPPPVSTPEVTAETTSTLEAPVSTPEVTAETTATLEAPVETPEVTTAASSPTAEVIPDRGITMVAPTATNQVIIERGITLVAPAQGVSGATLEPPVSTPEVTAESTESG